MDQGKKKKMVDDKDGIVMDAAGGDIDGNKSNDDNSDDYNNAAGDGTTTSLDSPPRKRAKMSETTNDVVVGTTDKTNEKTIAVTDAATGIQQERRLLEDESRTTTRATTTESTRKQQTMQVVPILHNVVACLSGLSPEQKQYYHTLIEKLGGRYTRNLVSTENTHLITSSKDGAKYELALQCQNIHIVTPKWLDACCKTQAYVKETKYQLVVRRRPEEVKTMQGEPPSADTTVAIEESIDQLLANYTNNFVAQNENLDSNTGCGKNEDVKKHGASVSSSSSSLFVSCHFLLVGFDDEKDEDGNFENDKRGEKGNQGCACTSKKRTTTINSLKMKLCKLIRRARGTIYWDIHPKITHIIVHNDTRHCLHDSLRNAVMIVSKNHVNLPKPISPIWIIQSYKNHVLQATFDYPPIEINSKGNKSNTISTGNRSNRSFAATAKNATSIAKARTANSSSSNIFRGCMFALVRLAPPSNVIDYDTKSLEQSIKRNGGQMISLKLIDALRVDVVRARTATRNAVGGAANANDSADSSPTKGASSSKPPQHLNQSGANKRICYVVCWGQIITQTHLDLNPIISQLYRHKLCHVVLVTPIWLQTCIDVQKMIPTHRFPAKLYTPQIWLFYRYTHSNNNDRNGSTRSKKNIAKGGKGLATDSKSIKRQTEQLSQDIDCAIGEETEATKKNVSNGLDEAQKLCVSVTGFSNSERAAIRNLLLAMGICYDGDMGPNCTHLIYKGIEQEGEDQRQSTTRTKDATTTTTNGSSTPKQASKPAAASTTGGTDSTAKTFGSFDPSTRGVSVVGRRGPKFEKAVERGLPVVSIDWLYRVARTGDC